MHFPFPSPESQQKEVGEMLEQEGLVDIAHSSPSEQVAYLLVERSTLLEKLEVLEQKLDSPDCLEKLCASQLQVCSPGIIVHADATTDDGLQLVMLAAKNAGCCRRKSLIFSNVSCHLLS